MSEKQSLGTVIVTEREFHFRLEVSCDRVNGVELTFSLSFLSSNPTGSLGRIVYNFRNSLLHFCFILMSLRHLHVPFKRKCSKIHYFQGIYGDYIRHLCLFPCDPLACRYDRLDRSNRWSERWICHVSDHNRCLHKYIYFQQASLSPVALLSSLHRRPLL